MKHRKIPVLFLLVLLAMCFMACAAEKTQKKDSVGNTTQEEPYYYEASCNHTNQTFQTTKEGRINAPELQRHHRRNFVGLDGRNLR